LPRIDLDKLPRQTKKLGPGLIAKDGDFAGEQWQRQSAELVRFADNFVPKAQRSVTPILFFGTAAMRLMRSSTKKMMLERIRQTLAATEYRFESRWARTLLAREEGGFAWIAANYLNGSFGGDGGGASRPTFGVIELGGGSMQVTFEVAGSVRLHSDDEFVFRTAQGRKHRLYAHGYDSFGLDHALERMWNSSLESSPEGRKEPCQPQGDPCYPKSYGWAARPEDARVGGGDWKLCTGEIQQILAGASAIDAPGRYTREPELTGPFIATVNFFLVQNLQRMRFERRGRVGPSAFEDGARRWCRKTFRRPFWPFRRRDDAACPIFCFALSYEAWLLTVLGVQEVEVVDTIRGVEVEWALGAALVHSLQSRPSAQVVREALARALR